jgi:integrase
MLNLPENPFTGIRKMKWDRQPQYLPPTEHILRVLAAATREEKVILYCYLLTGARRSEIFRWIWTDDINFQHRKYRLGIRKTRDGLMQYRWFDMPDDLYDELWWYYQNRPFKKSPYVFVNILPGPNYRKPFKVRRKFLKGLCKRAGVDPAFGFHALRRYFASALHDELKVSTKKIQELLRHSNLQTTEKYIYLVQEDLKVSQNGIAKLLKGNLHTDLHKKKGEPEG